MDANPAIPANNIIPFVIGDEPPADADLARAEENIPELNLSVPTPFRYVSPGVTEAMVTNPNSLLQEAIRGQPVQNSTVIQTSTAHHPVPAGSGTVNTAFLAGNASSPNPNAKAVEVDATFWTETLTGPSGEPDVYQLQYAQRVQLEFNGLRWPHVTVATLRK